MCMDLNGHPCLFLHAHLNRVSNSRNDKSCYEEASVFVFWGLNMVPRYEIGDTIYVNFSVLQFL